MVIASKRIISLDGRGCSKKYTKDGDCDSSDDDGADAEVENAMVMAMVAAMMMEQRTRWRIVAEAHDNSQVHKWFSFKYGDSRTSSFEKGKNAYA